MAIVADDIIDADDYNGIRNKVIKVLGDDGVDQKIGYGRAVSSSAKAEGEIITSADMTALYNDLELIKEHQNGFSETSANFTWLPSAPLNSPSAVEIIGATASIDATDGTTDDDEGFLDFSAVATDVLTFANNFPTSFPGAGSFTVDGLVSDTRTPNWNGTVSHTVTINFSNADARRHFFNAGGRIRFTAGLTGGNSVAGDQTQTYPDTPAYEKDEIWQTMLNVMSNIDFGRDGTTQPNSASGTPATTIGNYQLTNSDQTIFTKNGSGVYSENFYQIKAKNVSTKGIRFTISFVDADLGDDRNADAYDYKTDENVTGTISSVVQSVTPSTFLGIPEPSATEDVTLDGSTPTSYTLSTDVSTVDEGQNFVVTLDTTNLPNGTLVAYTITGVTSADINGASLTGTFNIQSNTRDITFTAATDQVGSEGDEIFSLTLDNGLGGTAEVTISDTTVLSSTDAFPSTVPHTGWGTLLHSVNSTNTTARATADVSVTNDNTNERITITSRTFDADTATPTEYTGFINYSNLVGTVTIEARYTATATTSNQQDGSRTPANNSTPNTWYTIANSASRTFDWIAEDTSASATTRGITSGSDVVFEVRITDDNDSTVLSSSSNTVDLEAQYTEAAQEINPLWLADDDSNSNAIDGDERIGFTLNVDGTTDRYLLIYNDSNYSITPSTAQGTPWLPTPIQSTNAGNNWQVKITEVSNSNSSLYGTGPTSTSSPTYSEGYNNWRVTQDFFGTYADVEVWYLGVKIKDTRYQPASNAQSVTSTTVVSGGVTTTVNRGTSETGYSYTQNWNITTTTSAVQFGTWITMTDPVRIYANGTEASELGNSELNLKIRKLGSATNDVNQSITIKQDLTTAANAVSIDGNLNASAISSGLSGSCNSNLYWNGTGQTPNPGVVYTVGVGNPGTNTPAVTWLNSGNASDYEVRFTYTVTLTGNGSTSGSYTSDPNPSSPATNGTIPTSGTWYPAEDYHRLRINDSGADPGDSSIAGTIDVRQQSTGTILATKGFGITANNDP